MKPMLRTNGRQLPWEEGKGRLVWGRSGGRESGDVEPPAIPFGQLKMRCQLMSRGLGGGALQGGSVREAGPDRALKPKAIMSPWLGPVGAWAPGRDSRLLFWERVLCVHRE